MSRPFQILHRTACGAAALAVLSVGGVASAQPAAASTTATTTSAVNVRSGPGTGHAVVGVAPGGTTLDTTATSGGWTQVLWQGGAHWISSNYLSAGAAPAASAPAPAAAAAGTVYVTVNSLNVRATSATNGAIVGKVSRDTALSTTGNTANNRTEVIHQGVARWVYSPYVSPSAPGSGGGGGSASGVSLVGYDRLTPNAKRVVDHVIANYPEIRAIGGYRASSDYSSDHPNGRAVDVMIPNWQNAANAEYGWQVARFFADNASTFNVSYIIYRQQSWNASYPARGWRGMADRGGATANHYDHVHISVRA